MLLCGILIIILCHSNLSAVNKPQKINLEKAANTAKNHKSIPFSFFNDVLVPILPALKN